MMADSVEEPARRRRSSDLKVAIRAFPSNERQESITNALREIEMDERRQLLMERFNKLSAEDMETALSYARSGGGKAKD